MRILKVTGWVVGGLFALLIIALFAIWLFVNPNDYKGRIAQAVMNSTGRDLSLPGDIKLSVFPWIALEFGPASLGSPPGFDNEPFAGVRHAALRIKLLPLLHRQLQIGRVTVDGLDLRLRKNAGGKGNWEGFGHTHSNSTAPSGSSGGEVLQDLAGVVVTDSRIAYQDKVLEHVNLDVGHLGARAPVPVKLSLDLISRRDALPIHIDGQFAAELDTAAQRYRLTALQFKGTYSPRTGAASLPWQLAAPDLSLDLSMQTLAAPNLSLDLAAAHIQAQVVGSKIIDAPRMSGTFQLAAPALPGSMGKLGMPLPVTRDARALSKLTVRGNYVYGGNALRADRLDVQLDESTLRGSVAITNLDTLALSFNLAIDRIDLDRYRGPASAAKVPPKADDKPVELAATPLKSLDASGTMTIGAATISGMKLTNLSIGVHAKDGITRIAPAKAQLYGGQYSGALSLDERTSEPVLNIDQTMTSIDVAHLLDDFAKSKRLSGRGNVNAHLSAHGRTSEDLIKNLSGHIDANLANGALEGIDIWYEINRAQSLLKQQALPSGSSTGRTAFDSFRASADVTNGIATTKDLNVASQQLRLTGQGSTNLVNQVIDYDIKATVLKTPAAAAQNIVGLTLAEIPVKITGTISRPAVRPDLAGMAKQRVQQELSKHKDELQQKLQEQLQNLIKR
jgi:AsmA protein